MSNLYVLSAIVLTFLVALLLLKKYSKPGSTTSLAYQSKTTLCSAAERSFLGVLDQLLTDRCLFKSTAGGSDRNTKRCFKILSAKRS